MTRHLSKISLSCTVIFIWVSSLFAQGPAPLWTKTYGGTDWDEAFSIDQTSDGGYIIVGVTSSFGAGSDDVYVLKTDANGDTLWTTTYGDTSYDWGESIQQTFDDGFIIAGGTYSFGAGDSDVYLIKTDANGDTLWTKTCGGTGHDWSQSVQQTSDTGFIIAGGTYSFGAGDSDVYLIKTDANGDTLWTRTHGGTGYDWGESIQQTSDDGYIIVGGTYSFGAGDSDVYLIKTDANGDTLWTRTYGETSSKDYGCSVQQTSDDGYIIAVWTCSFASGDKDVYIIRTDGNGDTLWTKRYGGPNGDIGYVAQQTSDGGFVVAGWTSSFGVGASDVYLVKTNASGDTLWTATYGNTDYDWGNTIQQTSDGGFIIAGVTYSSGARADVYLIKTEPEVIMQLAVSEDKAKCNQEVFVFGESKPNPFKDVTSIKYQLPTSGHVNIVVCNLLGQEVRTLVNDTQSKGIHTTSWDARDNFGRKVGSGVYFCKIQVYTDVGSGNYNTTKKTILTK